MDRLLTTLESSLAANSLVERFQVVCVDDGSTDRTAALLAGRRAAWLVVVSLPTRSGQSVALARGIEASRYGVLGRLDGDLQTTPDDFTLLLPWLERGFDCAHGVRELRRDPLVQRAASAVANAVRRAVLNDGFRDIGCPLTVFRRHCLDGIAWFTPFHRYLPFLIRAQGYGVKEIPVRHFPRLAGESKYGVANRLGIGVGSLLAMRWMARHHIVHRPPPSNGDQSASDAPY